MKCPSCGADQPFDSTCVRCDTNIGKVYRHVKIQVVVYRIVVGILLVLTIWLAREPSNPPAIRTPAPRPEDLTAADRSERKTSAETEPSQQETKIRKPSVVALFAQGDLFGHATFDGLQATYPHPIQTIHVNRSEAQVAEELEEATYSTVVAIGESAQNFASKEIGDVPVLWIDPPERVLSLQSLPANTYRIANRLEVSQELRVIHRLLTDFKKIILIQPEGLPRPEPTLVEELGLTLTAMDAENERLAGEIADASDSQTMIWLQGLTSPEMGRILELPAARSLVTVAFLKPSENVDFETADGSPEAEESVVFATIKPLLQLSVSAEGLGAFSATVLRRIDVGRRVDEEDLKPKRALQATVHLDRAVAIERSDLIGKISQSCRRTRIPYRLVP